MEKEICGIKEVAKYLNISYSIVRKLVNQKKFYFKVLSCIKFENLSKIILGGFFYGEKRISKDSR